RHIEHVIDIALEAEALLEHEGQHARAVGIDVGPDMAAIAEIARGLALDERRVGEQRGGDRLQRQAGAELAHHVGLGLEIQIHLNRAGAQHHVETELALLRHVAAHHGITPFGHPRHVVASRRRMKTHGEQAEAELTGHGAHLMQMLIHFAAGLVQVLDRRARQLELAAGLERDGAAAAVAEADQIAGIEHRLPAEAGEPLQQGADAIGTIIGHGRAVVQPEDELLVLRADAPCRARLGAGRQIVDELAPVAERRAAGGRWRRHGAGAGSPDSLEASFDQRGSTLRFACQSPTSAWKAASAASAAVSARSTRGPKLTAQTNGSFFRASSSVWVNPPSGPVSTAQGPGGAPRSASATGGDVPLSSHSSNRRAAGQPASSLASGSGSRNTGTVSRSVCSAASTALALSRSRLTRSTIVRSV